MSFIKKNIEFFIDGEFHIAYRRLDKKNPLIIEDKENNSKSRIKYNLLRPTWRYWYADPIIYEGDKTYVFMEVFDRIKNKGFIGVSYFKTNGKLGRPSTIIDESCHMSFPNVFDYRGNTYMIPESIAGGGLRIYKQGDSILDWKLYSVIEDIKDCVDTAIYIDEDTANLYLLTGMQNADNPIETAQRMYAITDWDTMKHNEIELNREQKKFACDTRNAGQLITWDKSLYRITQKSTPEIYGESMKVYKVSDIGGNGYTEELVRNISIDEISVNTIPILAHQLGIHTYGVTKKYEVIDVYVARASLFNAVRKLLFR